jgi:hypothetical protein
MPNPSDRDSSAYRLAAIGRTVSTFYDRTSRKPAASVERRFMNCDPLRTGHRHLPGDIPISWRVRLRREGQPIDTNSTLSAPVTDDGVEVAQLEIEKTDASNAEVLPVASVSSPDGDQLVGVVSSRNRGPACLRALSQR